MPKQRTCRVCDTQFTPQKPMQPVCGVKCAIKDARLRKKKDVRKADRKRKEELKTKNELIKDAQPVFNKYIRERDKNDPCISCGKFDHEIPDIFTGGKWDCGHYISRGAATELRFNEDNAHRQCKSCNGGSGKFAKKNTTVQKQYRINLIKKIGLERVEWLEGPHPMPNWTHDEIRAIKLKYRAKCKELQSNNRYATKNQGNHSKPIPDSL